MFAAVAVTTLLLILAAVTIVVSLGLQRLADGRRQARVDQLTERLSPQVIDFVADAAAAPPPVDPTDRLGQVVVTGLLTSYGRLLRGQSRERIRAWLADSGALARARSDLAARRTSTRRAAVTLLGAFGDDADTDALWRAMMQDRKPGVRLAALQALAALSSPQAIELFTHMPAQRPLPDLMVVDALRRLAPQHPQPLAQACLAGPPLRRQLACEAVAVVGAADNSPLAEAVRTAAREEQPPPVRSSALYAIAVLGVDGGQIRAGLGQHDETVAAGALRGAAALADPGLLADVATWLSTTDEPVASLAAAAYLACGGSRQDTPLLREAADLASLH